jgi:rhamnogalacturonan endolyase
MRSPFGSCCFSGTWILVLGVFLLGAHAAHTAPSPPVAVSESADTFTLSNGLLSARIEKRTGTLVSLTYNDLEFLAQRQSGANGGYWSSVGRGRPGSQISGVIRIDPTTNNGARAEISCQLHNDPDSPTSPVDADYHYSLGRGEHWLYVYSVLHHKPGYPAFGVGEARYCLKLNPEVFDYMTIDKDRHRIMPSGYDWDHGEPLNLKEARRMTTGIHKGEPEHKYDYSAVFSETPAYGWSSTKHLVGIWMINPSLEYIGGGPTKAELTGHLDVNPGGLPTLLNMWVGSHYGGTSLSIATNESWTKVVGPFVLYCNSDSVGRTSPGAAQNPEMGASTARSFAARGDARPTDPQLALWHDALAHANAESNLWPYAWLSDPDYPPASRRATITGQLTLHDPFSPNLKMSNIWVGVAAPDYTPPRFGFRSGFGRTNSNFATNAFWRGGFPPQVDWQRDAKFYQFWTRADAKGRFTIPNVRPGNYTFHAIADGILGEFTVTNLAVSSAEKKSLGKLEWIPTHFGRTVWQIGIPDRTAGEFRHGDHYWQWGLYFDYPKEFPNDVNFIIGKSDWHNDWNYVQPPGIESRKVAIVGEDDEQNDTTPRRARLGSRDVRSTAWSITFALTEPPLGKATLRLAFCGTHSGCNVEAFANDKSIGETGPLPSTSAMQRDGIRAYWIEKDLSFDASLLSRGTNVIKLLSHADGWSQGVMYDCVRLELDDSKSAAITR